ncbi:MAG TPA: UDP-N-acetylglucosamine 1-carboxyvinyltransferase [Candidatus Xenobia bacterium]|nr:UDP-N-acetylglucosamine 1-carboxyvinyltransferase [Candidatus Xenobia bacterium]
MDRFVIEGGRALRGRVAISGAKNAALPAMAAALLTTEPVQLSNLPRVRDIVTMKRLLQHMGVEVTPDELHTDGELRLEAARLTKPEAPYELVKTMRASVLALGPLVARCGQARVSLPGGCAIGARPIDLHLRALERLGATLEVEHGYVLARAERLRGTHILFDKITVTGTENLMMAACLAEGETVLENAAREPEVGDLAALLRAMGAKIEGDGTSTIRIRGVERLRGAKHRVIGDRIEAGTFFIAAAITGGELSVSNCDCQHLHAVLHQLEAAGAQVQGKDSSCVLVAADRLRAADVTTEEYPGFPTDMQAQYMALMTQAEGASIITESIFENRFLHAQELVRMGANISVEGRRAVVRGPTPLSGANVLASDLRASASLVLAGLAAQGETVIDRVYHIDRGYERIEEKLSAVGARIRRIQA